MLRTIEMENREYIFNRLQRLYLFEDNYLTIKSSVKSYRYSYNLKNNSATITWLSSFSNIKRMIKQNDRDIELESIGKVAFIAKINKDEDFIREMSEALDFSRFAFYSYHGDKEKVLEEKANLFIGEKFTNYINEWDMIFKSNDVLKSIKYLIGKLTTDKDFTEWNKFKSLMDKEFIYILPFIKDLFDKGYLCYIGCLELNDKKDGFYIISRTGEKIEVMFELTKIDGVIYINLNYRKDIDNCGSLNDPYMVSFILCTLLRGDGWTIQHYIDEFTEDYFYVPSKNICKDHAKLTRYIKKIAFYLGLKGTVDTITTYLTRLNYHDFKKVNGKAIEEKYMKSEASVETAEVEVEPPVDVIETMENVEDQTPVENTLLKEEEHPHAGEPTEGPLDELKIQVNQEAANTVNVHGSFEKTVMDAFHALLQSVKDFIENPDKPQTFNYISKDNVCIIDRLSNEIVGDYFIVRHMQVMNRVEVQNSNLLGIIGLTHKPVSMHVFHSSDYKTLQNYVADVVVRNRNWNEIQFRV